MTSGPRHRPLDTDVRFDDSISEMPDLAEYTYAEQNDHLTDVEAMEQYAALRREQPDALVVLRDLDCGHWQIKAYETDVEKNAYLRRRLESMLKVFWAALRLPTKP